MSFHAVLSKITTSLDRAGIECMLVGSLASACYGIARSTQDIDFVAVSTAEQVRAFVSSLSPAEHYVELEAALEAHSRQSMFNVLDVQTGWKVDLIFRKSRAFSVEEFTRRRRIEIEGIHVFVASPEDVVLSKLEWAKLGQSDRQISDAASVLRSGRVSLDRPYLEKWVAALGLRDQWEDARRQAGEMVGESGADDRT